MPSALHLEFFQDARRTVPGGLYVLSSPESKYYRPQRGYKKAYKLGSSWNLGKRINGYLLSFPCQRPHSLEIEAALLMNLAHATHEKRTIAVAERYVHSQLHGHYRDQSHYPGSGASRLNTDKIEWYSGIDLEVIMKLLKHELWWSAVPWERELCPEVEGLSFKKETSMVVPGTAGLLP